MSQTFGGIYQAFILLLWIMNFELYCSKRIFILLLSNYVNIVLIVYFAIFQKLIFQKLILSSFFFIFNYLIQFFIKFKAQGQI